MRLVGKRVTERVTVSLEENDLKRALFGTTHFEPEWMEGQAFELWELESCERMGDDFELTFELVTITFGGDLIEGEGPPL